MNSRGSRGDVVVVGGGIVGCTIAYYLATKHRARVVVLERSVPGAEASSAAAGILGAQVESGHHGRAPSDGGALFRLLLASRALHRELDARLREEVGFGTGFHPCGVMRVTRTEAGRRELATAHEWQVEHGGRVELVDAIEARRLEPELSLPDEGGAVVLPDEAQVDPPRLLRALQQACARASVTFRSGTLVQGIELLGGEARGVRTAEGVVAGDAVVVAAGSWSSLVGGLPDGMRRVHPVRGQIVQVETRPPIATRVVFGDGGYVVPRPDGRVLLGSTMEEVGHVKEVTVGGVHDVLGASMALFPKLAQAPISATWSGFRPATRGDRPMLGKTSIPSLFIATGHHRNGVLMAPETARLLADLVALGRCDRDLSAFSPEG